MNIWIELLTSAFEVLLVLYFFSAYLGRADSGKLLRGLCLSFYFAFLAVLSVVFPASMSRTAGIVLITYLFALLYWNKGYIQTIYPILLFFLFSILSDILCGTLLQLQGIPVEELMGDGRGRIIYIVFGKLFHLLFLYLVLFIVGIKSQNRRYDKTLLFEALPLISCQILSIFICDSCFTSISSAETVKTANIVTLGLLYTNFIICVYVDVLNRSFRKAREAEEAKHQLEIQKNYYHDVMVRQDETRRLWHDIKKYKAAMEALVNLDKTQSAKESLAKLEDSFKGIESSVDTGNALVDSILNYGMKKAISAGVTLRPKIWVSESLYFPADDLFVIMGNTIDNAIEACAALSDSEKRVVDISLVQKNHVLLYEIENPYSGSPKKQGDIHGYGLRNVQACVQHSSGEMLVSKENSVFKVTITLNTST